MKYYYFSIRQKRGDETREMELTVQAWGIKDAFAAKREWEDKQDGWWTIGSYLHKGP